MKNKEWLKNLWRFYSAIGAIWLTFSIVGFVIFDRSADHDVSGTIQEIIETEWDGFKEVHALVETKDGKGNVMVRIYRAGSEKGDEVSLEISTRDRAGGYIFSKVK